MFHIFVCTQNCNRNADQRGERELLPAGQTNVCVGLSPVSHSRSLPSPHRSRNGGLQPIVETEHSILILL